MCFFIKGGFVRAFKFGKEFKQLGFVVLVQVFFLALIHSAPYFFSWFYKNFFREVYVVDRLWFNVVLWKAYVLSFLSLLVGVLTFALDVRRKVVGGRNANRKSTNSGR